MKFPNIGKFGILILGILIGLGINYLWRVRPEPRPAPPVALDKTKPQEPPPVAHDHGRMPMPQAGDETITSPASKTPSLKLGESAQKLAEIAVSEVAYRPLTKEIRTVGKLNYDESRLAYVTARIDGRIDRLFANFTGVVIKQGDHLALLYSPELVSAQTEYLLSLKNLERIKDSKIKEIVENSRTMVEASRNKMLLYGITPDDIRQIEERGEAQARLVITAPIGGTVIQKDALEGKYVKTGDPLYTIADLSRVWLYIDVYEYDLPWIKFGQYVEVTAESFPGARFSGRLVFINPFLNEETRTVKVRVNMENKEGKLKPGMYANAYIKVKISRGGRVEMADLEGKYMCPMHPEVVREEPGSCPICGMKLEPIGGLLGKLASGETGVGFKASAKGVLSVPRSAVMDTGQRKLVYIERSPGVYEPREVEVGPQAGDYYPALSGLKAGEKVVTAGNLLIDSQMQISGKPSLIFPGGTTAGGAHAGMEHGETKR